MTDLTIDDIRERIIQNMAMIRNLPEKTPKTSVTSETNYSFNVTVSEKIAILNNEVREANIKYNIVTELPITSHRKYIGHILNLGRKVVREGLRWYVKPPIDQQRDFNVTVVRSLNQLKDIMNIWALEVESTNARFAAAEQETNNKLSRLQYEFSNISTELTLISYRLKMLEKYSKTGPVSGEDDKKLNINYFLFEQKMRGDRNNIKEAQKKYVHYFLGKHMVLDIGCGRGEFIELLKENGVGVSGIDIDENMVDYCKELNLPVVKGNAFAYLESLEDGSLGGIFSAQVIEHLLPQDIIRLIELSYKKLEPHGVLILETINPENFVALSKWFYIDMSHKTPVHPATLRFIIESVGLTEIEQIDSNSNIVERIPLIEDGTERAKEINTLIDQINGRLYGPQDYAIVARKQV